MREENAPPLAFLQCFGVGGGQVSSFTLAKVICTTLNSPRNLFNSLSLPLKCISSLSSSVKRSESPENCF